MARKNGPLVVCVINMKGGVGKSTISAMLSRAAFRDRSADLLSIDLDPQANLSQALMPYSYDRFLTDGNPSIVEVFAGYRPPTTTTPSPGSLSATDAVVTIQQLEDRSLQLIPSRFDFSDNLTASVRPDPRVLARYLSDRFKHKDLIIIDCAPTESVLTQAAYHSSGLVLVPVKPEYFATIGFPLLQQSLRQFRSANRGHRISVAGVVINNGFYNGGNNGGPEKARAMGEITREALKNDWKIFERQIPFSRGFPKLMRGDYSYQGNAGGFWWFAKEFFDEIGI